MPYFYVEFTLDGWDTQLVEAAGPGEALKVALRRKYSLLPIETTLCTKESGSSYRGWFKAHFHIGPVDEEEEECNPEDWAREKRTAWR
jgi:hypothetical protein